MAKDNNLKDFLTDIANAIREKEGTNELINPQDFSSRIAELASSSGLELNLKGGLSNKLNGSELVIPSNAVDGSVLHTYNVDKSLGNKWSLYILPYYGSFNPDLRGLGNNFLSYKLEPLFYVPVISDHYFSGYDVQSINMAVKVKSVIDANLYLSILNNIDTSYGGDEIVDVTVILVDLTSNIISDFDTFCFRRPTYTCFKEDTLITLADLKTKKVQDITYNDKLLTWNFDKGEVSTDDVFWIKKEEEADYYYEVTLENGICIELIGSNGKCHRLFSCESQSFESATDLVGKKVFTMFGEFKVKKCKRIDKPCKYYNVITKNNINLFANNILSSCRYNNVYPIKDMKYIKDGEKENSTTLMEFMKAGLKREDINWYKVLRLGENSNETITDSLKYIENLKGKKKCIEDFNENKEVLENSDNINVGWIDPEGNVYGYPLYMSGQKSHEILAKIICEKLGFNNDTEKHYSFVLDKMGWVKFSNEYLSSSNKYEITDKQEQKIRKFIEKNEKVKNKGKIKMGSIFGEENSIDDIKVMYKEELNKKMKGK